MSRSKEEYQEQLDYLSSQQEQLEYLEWQKKCITDSIDDIRACLNRIDDREAEFHQQQLEQQEQNHD